jgi:hypothetical protein
MDQWVPKPKRYPHFGAPLAASKTAAIATSPSMVARHAFLPFISCEKKRRRFKKGEKRELKVRPIKFASSTDANIFSYYRDLLSRLYEQILVEREIADCVIAYRKIPVEPGKPQGKCNIHFTNEVFDLIRLTKRCCVVALDVKSFFESLDHGRLKHVWCQLLGETRLPEDHYAVFKQLTRQPTISRDVAFERLGYSERDKRGVLRYVVARNDMPRQLCSSARFREEVRKRDGEKLIVPNDVPYGVPQGAPLSDLLANAYLIEFDAAMAAYVRSKGGYYRRYSDDILVIVPGDGRAGRGAREFTERLMRQQGTQLKIKPEKTNTVCFVPSEGRLLCRRVGKGKNAQGLEYLGFRFDGKNIYIRNSTIANLQRKIRSACWHEAQKLVARYPGKTKQFMMEKHFHILIRRFGRVPDFEHYCDCREWTFWTYVKKSTAVFGKRGLRIYQQLDRIKNQARSWLEKDIERALTLREFHHS